MISLFTGSLLWWTGSCSSGGLFGGPKLQKRWCAIKHNIFYYYESAKERKQHGAFYLNGYYLEAAPEAVDKKDSARRELSFQLVCPAKRTYQVH